MIDPDQAQTIVHDCIHEVVNTNEQYDSNKRLGQFGLIADDVVRTFTREIRENTSSGVKAFDHTLAAKELSDVNSETLTGDVEEIIMTKSTPTPQGLITTAGAAPAKTHSGKPTGPGAKDPKKGGNA